jgi:hypothetical protein
MVPVAPDLSDVDDGFLRGKKYLLMDRDTRFSYAFRSILEHADVQAVRLPLCSPDLNSHVERFMRSVKDECHNDNTRERQSRRRGASAPWSVASRG